MDVYFGTEVPDPYRWLEDDNSAETAEWVKVQNAVTNSYLEKIPQRAAIKKRLTEIWNYEKITAPFKKGEYYFYYRNDGVQNQSVLYMKKGLDGTPSVLIDPNTFSEDGTQALSGLAITEDAKYAAYSVSKAGSDWADIFVKDITTGEVLKDHLKWVKFSGMSWLEDGFYYSRYDTPEEGTEFSQTNQFQKVYYHKVGTSQKEDELVYRDDEHPKRSFYVALTEDKSFLIIGSYESTSGNGIQIRDLQSGGDILEILPGYENDYDVIDNVGRKLLVKTNDGAPNNRVVLVDPSEPNNENWKVVIPERKSVLMSVNLCNGQLIAKYLEDVSSRLYRYSLQGELLGEIELPGIGMVDAINSYKDDSIAFYSFSNFTMPSTIYKYNNVTNTSSVYVKPNIDFDSESLITKQVFYNSKDGTSIPMFITHKRGVTLNGMNPTLLFGYGGFNISYTPGFRIDRSVFLENNGVYAIANIRGGGEYGEKWHKAGIKQNKQNVFDDLIAATEYLIAEKYTNKDKLAIHGRSNGGLLIGAVITQRPDICKVAIPKVGVLDMLRYHKFTIGYAWATDYGTSEETEEMFNYLLGYSPLHNVKPASYPATMIITGDHDDRVVPAHSFKFAAEMQRNHNGTNPVLIRIDSKAGHGSGKPVSKQIDEFADTWAFVFHNLGMEIRR